MVQHRWLAFVAVLLGMIYVRAYFVCPLGPLEVAQTRLSGCGASLLLEKRPLVITDRLVDHGDLLRHAYRGLYAYAAKPRTTDRVASFRSVARFTLLHSGEDVRVDAVHPATREGVCIVLRAHQTLALPPRWLYVVPTGVTIRELHDVVSWLVRAFTPSPRPSPPGQPPIPAPARSGSAH